MTTTKIRLLCAFCALILIVAVCSSFFVPVTSACAADVKYFGSYLSLLGLRRLNEFYSDPFFSSFFLSANASFTRCSMFPETKVCIMDLDGISKLPSDKVVNSSGVVDDSDYLVLSFAIPSKSSQVPYLSYDLLYYVLDGDYVGTFPLISMSAFSVTYPAVEIISPSGYASALDGDYWLYSSSVVGLRTGNFSLEFTVKFNFIDGYSTVDNLLTYSIPVSFSFPWSAFIPNFPLSAWDDEWEEMYYYNNLEDLYTAFKLSSGDSFTSYQNGFEAGQSVGYDSGYSSGLSIGISQGKIQANNTVTTTSSSYTAGYSAGVNAAGNYTFGSLIGAVFDGPLNAFRSLFDFEILGVNLTGFLSAIFVICIVVTIVRLTLGG